jgi:hypothetical protein
VASCAASLLGVGVLSGCGAVYPEIATPVHPAPSGSLEPPPPDDLLFITFESATIPSRTRDGRQWDAVGGSAPDPFAQLFVDDQEIIKTPVQSNTLHPTWPDQVKANYVIPRGAKVRVEMWDSNALTDHPICVKQVSELSAAAAGDGEIDVHCDSDARIKLQVEPAHAKLGLGLYYELRTQDVYVTRVVTNSPAGRVKLAQGDQIKRVQGKDVRKLKEAELRTLINGGAAAGVTLTIQHADGKVEDVTLKEGPIYPTLDDQIPVQ